MKTLATNDILIEQLIVDPNYEVLVDGSIRTLITSAGNKSATNVWRNLTHFTKKGGYVEVNYRYKKLALHRVMYRKFVGMLSPELVVNHKDGNPSNNLCENLELITVGQNNEHRYRVLGHKAVKGNKTIDFRVANAMRVLNSKHGISGYALAEAFNMDKGWVSQVLNNKIWTTE